MARKLILAPALPFILLPGASFALELGEIRSQSGLNESFVGEIDLLDVTPEALESLEVRLASDEELRQAGVERLPFLAALELRVQVSPNGRPVIRVTSQEPVREPFLDFLVEVTGPDGRLVKEYTVLLDPPANEAQKGPASETREPGFKGDAAVAEVAALGQDLLRVREEVEGSRRETQELRERIQELEARLDDIRAALGARVGQPAEAPSSAVPDLTPSADGATGSPPSEKARESASRISFWQASPWNAVPKSALGLAVAGLLLLLLLVAMILRRRGREAEPPADEGDSADQDLPSRAEEHDFIPVMSRADGEAYAVPDGTKASLPATMPCGGLEDREEAADEADSLSEADVYIAYGQYGEAAALLGGAIAKTPGRLDLRLKLAEVHFGAGNLAGLREIVSDLQRAAPDRIKPEQWQRLKAMARDLEAGEGEAAPPSFPVGSAPESAQDLESALDFVPADSPAGALGAGEAGGAQGAELKESGLDWVPAAEAPTKGLASHGPMESVPWDPLADKIDLARAYQERGDADAARFVLQEVLRDGSEAHQTEARDILGRLR